jgi:small membrane protein
MLIQLILAVVLLLALGITWKRARQAVISFQEALAWSVLWIAAGIVVLLPDTTSILARLVGVGRGADLAMYAAVTLLFVLVFKLFLSLDRMERRLTELVQRDALRDLDANDRQSS